MKNYRLFRFLPALTLIFLLSSCKKDFLVQAQPDPDSNLTVTVPKGAVQARILLNDGNPFPASIIANNDNFTSEELFADEEGYVSLTNIPEGVYTVTVYPSPDDLGNPRQKTVIQNITIIADQVTDIGTITYEP